MDSGQEFENWLNRKMVKTDMGYSANPDAVPEGTDPVEHAMTIVRRAQADAERQVRSRTAPGDQARLVGIARTFLNARARAEAEKQAVLDQVAADANILRAQLYGAGGRRPTADEIRLRRDADHLVADLTDPDQALRLLKKAEMRGDEALAAAVFERASEYASSALFGGPMWRPVITAYTSSRPDAAAAVEQLLAIPNYSSPKARFALEGEYHVPTPSELSHLSAQQIEALASSDLAD